MAGDGGVRTAELVANHCSHHKKPGAPGCAGGDANRRPMRGLGGSSTLPTHSGVLSGKTFIPCDMKATGSLVRVEVPRAGLAVYCFRGVVIPHSLSAEMKASQQQSGVRWGSLGQLRPLKQCLQVKTSREEEKPSEAQPRLDGTSSAAVGLLSHADGGAAAGSFLAASRNPAPPDEHP